MVELRQSSQLQLNRRVQWSQDPPNMKDYAPECLESSALGPFQQAPPEQGKSSSKRPPSITNSPSKSKKGKTGWAYTPWKIVHRNLSLVFWVTATYHNYESSSTLPCRCRSRFWTWVWGWGFSRDSWCFCRCCRRYCFKTPKTSRFTWIRGGWFAKYRSPQVPEPRFKKQASKKHRGSLPVKLFFDFYSKLSHQWWTDPLRKCLTKRATKLEEGISRFQGVEEKDLSQLQQMSFVYSPWFAIVWLLEQYFVLWLVIIVMAAIWYWWCCWWRWSRWRRSRWRRRWWWWWWWSRWRWWWWWWWWWWIWRWRWKWRWRCWWWWWCWWCWKWWWWWWWCWSCGWW